MFWYIVNKVEDFRRNLDYSTKKIIYHSSWSQAPHYVINAHQLSFSLADVNDIGNFGVQTLHNAFEGNNGYLPTHSMYQPSNVDGVFGGRLTILNRIIQRKLVRPLHNIRHNNI